jgi:predicted dehydrogenase
LIRENWIYANSTHTVDLLRFFAGEPKIINTLSKSFNEKNGDQFVASFEFDSGTIGSYSSHWYSPGGWSIKLFGENITVQFNPLENGIWIDNEFTKHKILPDKNDIKYKPGFCNQILAFIKMVNTGSLDWPGVDLQDSLKTMELAKGFIVE